MRTIITIAIVCLSVLFSCKKEEKSEDKKLGVCPTLSDPISWENGIVKYGEWQFRYTWIDGNFGVATGGAEVNNIHNDCGCPFNSTETGGVGNTYAVYLAEGSDVAVIFRWKNNSFCELEVFEKWQGKTEKSVQMNCLMGDFLQQYSGHFTVSPADSTQYDAVYSTNIYVTAWFTQKEVSQGKLKKLKISGPW